MSRSIRVDYNDGTSKWYPIPEGKGWKIDPTWRCLLVGVPASDRIIVPLDRVDAIQLEVSP